MKKSFSFYLEEDIINELKKQAKQEKISLSELCRRKLTQENQPVHVEQVYCNYNVIVL